MNGTVKSSPLPNPTNNHPIHTLSGEPKISPTKSANLALFSLFNINPPAVDWSNPEFKTAFKISVVFKSILIPDNNDDVLPFIMVESNPTV